MSEFCDHPNCDEQPDGKWKRRAGTPHRFCSSDCLLDYWNNHSDRLQGLELSDEQAKNRARALADVAEAFLDDSSTDTDTEQ